MMPHLRHLAGDRDRQAESRLGALPLPGLGTGGAAFVQLKVKTVADNHLVCRTWDGAEEGNSDVLVAMPPTLRRTSFDGQMVAGWTYAWIGPAARLATRPGYTSTNQSIWPDYPNAVIYALRVAQPTGLAIGDVKVRLVDANVDARQWTEICS